MNEEDRLNQLLRRPLWLRQRLTYLLEERETARRRCTRTTSRYGGGAVARCPGSGGGFSERDRVLAELADADRKVELCRDRLAEATAQAEAVLRCVEELPCRTALRDADLLRLLCLRGLTGRALRDTLEQDGFPARPQTIYNWLRTAKRSGVTALASMEAQGATSRKAVPPNRDAYIFDV